MTVRDAMSCSVQPGGMSVEPPGPGVVGAMDCSAPWLMAGLAAAVGLALAAAAFGSPDLAGLNVQTGAAAGVHAAMDAAARPPPVSAAARRKPRRESESPGGAGSEAAVWGVAGAADEGWVRMERSSRARPPAGSDLRPGSTGPLSLRVPLRAAARLRSVASPGSTTNSGAAFPVDALEALDAATRAIAGVLDLDAVLQLIVERVCALADARYAALGIVDEFGGIERFITVGITP